MKRDGPPSTIRQLLAPFPVDEFLTAKWGKEYLLIEGDPAKFTDLLPWSVLNSILEQHRLNHPRLRLAQDGETLLPSSFIDSTRARRGYDIPRIQTTDLTRLLRQGATLIVDAIDELYEPITSLASSLEVKLRERIQVNAYACWGSSQGFNLHWDDHDVFVAQVVGRKKWSIYGPSRKYPLFKDVNPDFESPTEILWEGELTAGDMLYLPRGWWHVATAAGEPTVHLTFGVTKRTGVDLLFWLQDKLRASESFRKDLPRFASNIDRRLHMEQLKDELVAFWSSPLTLLEEYYLDHDSEALPRIHMSLPWSAQADSLPLPANSSVRVTTPRPLEWSHRAEKGTIELRAIGKIWSFEAVAEPILQILFSGDEHKVDELFEVGLQCGLEQETIQLFIYELLAEGLIVISN